MGAPLKLERHRINESVHTRKRERVYTTMTLALNSSDTCACESAYRIPLCGFPKDRAQRVVTVTNLSMKVTTGMGLPGQGHKKGNWGEHPEKKYK